MEFSFSVSCWQFSAWGNSLFYNGSFVGDHRKRNPSFRRNEVALASSLYASPVLHTLHEIRVRQRKQVEHSDVKGDPCMGQTTDGKHSPGQDVDTGPRQCYENVAPRRLR